MFATRFIGIVFSLLLSVTADPVSWHQFLNQFSSSIRTLQTYSNYEQYVRSEILLKTTTNITTTANNNIFVSTNKASLADKAEIISNKIDDYVKTFKILIPSILGAVAMYYTILCFTIKLYKNNCEFKVRRYFPNR